MANGNFFTAAGVRFPGCLIAHMLGKNKERRNRMNAVKSDPLVSVSFTKSQILALRRILQCEIRECGQKEKEAARLLYIRPECRAEPDFWRESADEAQRLYDHVGEVMGCRKS